MPVLPHPSHPLPDSLWEIRENDRPYLKPDRASLLPIYTAPSNQYES